MTDNKDALSALDAIQTQIHQHIELRLEYNYVTANTDEIQAAISGVQTIRAALTTSPSADVSAPVNEIRTALKNISSTLWGDQPDTFQARVSNLITEIYQCIEHIEALQSLPDAQGWRDISTVPRDGTEIEVWSKFRCHIGYASYTEGEVITPTITHWRVASKPPQPAKDKSK